MPHRPKTPEARTSASSSGWRSIERFGDSEWEPPVDVLVSSDVVWVRLAAPGVTLENLRIRVRGRTVLLLSRRLVRRPPRGCEFVRAEIPLGGFERRVELPWDAHPEALQITAAHGIVELLFARDGAQIEVDADSMTVAQENEDGR